MILLFDEHIEMAIMQGYYYLCFGREKYADSL